MKTDLSPPAPASVWESMVREEEDLQSLELGSKGNTEPTIDGIDIPREWFRDWNIYYKFRRDFLEPTRRHEAEQVFTQIYQYMNERHCVIHYLLTDQELICDVEPGNSSRLEI